MKKGYKWKVIGIGFFANTTINFIFDYILYPTALIYFGTILGGVIMTIASVVSNFCLILLYSAHDVDWFGFEEVRLKKDEEKGSKFIKWIFKLGHWPTYIALSFYDPFLGFVYAKGKRKSYKHFNTKDWGIFLISHLIGNGGWILLLSGVIKIGKLLFN